MSPKTDTEVIIGGKVFTLSGYESEDYMQKIASYINGKITEYGKLDGFRRQQSEDIADGIGFYRGQQQGESTL